MKLEESVKSIRNEDLDLILRKLDSIKSLLEQKTSKGAISIEKNFTLSTNRAAEYLEISRSQLFKLTASGEIPYAKVGGRRKYSIKDLDKYNHGQYFDVKPSIIPQD